MTFWMVILFGVLGAILVNMKCSFHAIWIMIFNLCISIYVAIMLAPLTIKAFPKESVLFGYQASASILVVAILTFVILYIAASATIGMDVEITLPALCEKIALPVLGFIAGFMVCSFVLFLILITPLINKDSVDTSNPSGFAGPLVTAPIIKTCTFVNSASMQCFVNAPKAVIDDLIGIKENDDDQKADESSPNIDDQNSTPEETLDEDILESYPGE